MPVAGRVCRDLAGQVLLDSVLRDLFIGGDILCSLLVCHPVDIEYDAFHGIVRIRLGLKDPDSSIDLSLEGKGLLCLHLRSALRHADHCL